VGSRGDDRGAVSRLGAGKCEHRDTTDPGLVKLILDVKAGTGGAYWWVTCQACAISWQTPYEIAEAV
jgi:hypothetical protein